MGQRCPRYAAWRAACAVCLLLLASGAAAARVKEMASVGQETVAGRDQAETRHSREHPRADGADRTVHEWTMEGGLEGLENIKRAVLRAHKHDQRRVAQHLAAMAAEEAEERGEEVHLPRHSVPDSDDPEEEAKFCHKRTYRKSTMKTIKEAPFIGLFSDLGNISRFEGSSITYAEGAFWVVFDSLRALGKIDIHFQFRGDGNRLIPEDVGEKESQFEGLQYMPSTGTFLAVRESYDHDLHGLVPLTEEISVNKDHTEWTLASVCPVVWKGLEDENKGWEGIHYFEEKGERFLLGLCESNYCKTIQGDDPPGLRRGHGRLILTKLNTDTGKHESDDCHWEYIKTINVPEEAYFLDYAGIAFWKDPMGSRVAIVSQEDAAVWVGSFDWDAMEFESEGKVYFFPRNPHCEKIYCNVEGLTWLDHQRLLFASDRSKPTQPFACMTNDQSVHIMALP